jgi:hypothetical protein
VGILFYQFTQKEQKKSWYFCIVPKVRYIIARGTLGGKSKRIQHNEKTGKSTDSPQEWERIELTNAFSCECVYTIVLVLKSFYQTAAMKADVLWLVQIGDPLWTTMSLDEKFLFYWLSSECKNTWAVASSDFKATLAVISSDYSPAAYNTCVAITSD